MVTKAFPDLLGKHRGEGMKQQQREMMARQMTPGDVFQTMAYSAQPMIETVKSHRPIYF
jgi:hypothetical protein